MVEIHDNAVNKHIWGHCRIFMALGAQIYMSSLTFQGLFSVVVITDVNV